VFIVKENISLTTER